jgi:dTDP-4-dehydrorhamnose 3,5-epimerase
LKIISQLIPDILVIKPSYIEDKRGYFAETFRLDLLEKAVGSKIDFVQENESQSSYGVLRGLHYQLPPCSQAKLVRVSQGRVLDVAVDIRKASSNFGKYVAVELSAENKLQLFIPRGFAHGFVVLSDRATFNYKVDNYYSPNHDRGIAFDDKKIGINWKLPLSECQLSDKDKSHPSLDDATSLFV